jgi:cadmium resistance transport/sequestration family protein
MYRLIEVIITGIASFTATNLDDIIVLTVFFAQVNPSFRSRHIIFGQYLGFIAIILLSLPGFLGGLVLDKKWIGILGFLPIIIGISKLLNRQNNETEVQTVAEEINSSQPGASFMSIFNSIISPQTYKVAVVTFANGGDNIGIYVPLFASSNLTKLGIILSIFFVMIAIWCCIAYQLTRNPVIANILTQRGDAIVPFVLIGLGIYILIDSDTYLLLAPSK